MSAFHEFALYSHDVVRSSVLLQAGDTLQLTDEQLLHRIKHVLRLHVDEVVVLFDQTHHIRLQLVEVHHKKSISAQLLQVMPNTILTPSITVLLPLLKKDALEQALYACVELGATQVQLITTHKVQRPESSEKELTRLQAIMIAAAEQSKNFAFPTLHAPITLAAALAALPAETHKICAAVQGQPILPVLQPIQKASLALLVGPEGDLTDSEYAFVEQQGFALCALTPTVLRAQQALVVLLGVVRCASTKKSL
jgi:16S rRNA (uracil1498-N3)-methyltransferase